MSVNDILFTGGPDDDGLHSCWDAPRIDIAWDMWTRTRIRCMHGVFEGHSDVMDLEQGAGRAMESFIASLATGIHEGCWGDRVRPADAPWGDGDCGLILGHEGEHLAYESDEAEAYWAEHRVYYIGGVDVTGKHDMPTTGRWGVLLPNYR